MPVIHSNDLTLLRTEGHRSDIYASFLKPLTLHASRVNSGTLNRGDKSIPFDTGSGSHYSAVEALQTLWIGTTPGDNDVGKVRIRSVTSGDGGITGTFSVAPNNIVWADDQYLTVKHNYELWPMYPYIDPATEVFYKDGDIAYSSQNVDVPPAGVLNIWPRAQFVRNGEAVFWIDASDSYAIKNGETISSYALSVYPSTGVTTTFNVGTGIGYVVVTSASQEYYWIKLTVTDSNGQSQSTYRCVFAHSTNRLSNYFPHINFQVNQLTGAWDRGGWYSQLMIHDNSALDDVPDETFTVLWKESYWGLDSESPVIVRSSNRLYVNPSLSYTITDDGLGCANISGTFHAGILDDGGYVSDGTAVSVDVLVGSSGCPGASSQNINGVTTDSQANINFTFSNVDPSSFLFVQNAANTVTIHKSSNYVIGTIVTNSSAWPSSLIAFPKEMLVGYLRRDHLTSNLDPARGNQQNQVEITTIDDLLRNQFMFSISLEARPDGNVNKWYRYNKYLTIGRAAHHVFKWHSTLMEIADVIGLTDNTDGRAYAEFENGSLYSMPDEMARYRGIRAHFVSSKRGELHLTQDVQLLPDTPRAAITTIANVEEEDKGGEISILRNPEHQVAYVYCSGIVYNNTFAADARGKQMPEVEPYCSTAPTSLPADDGQGTVDLDRQVITSQLHVNQLSGRVFAQVNNHYPEFRIPFHGDYLDVLDIHLAEFWEIDLLATDTIREIARPDTKLIPRQINCSVRRTEETFNGALTLSAVFEPEQDGYNGVSATYCFGVPELPGEEEIPTDGPGAIITGNGSVYYLPPDSSAWTLRTSDNTSDLIQDPWWRLRAITDRSGGSIVLRSGVGVIERSEDAGQNWDDITPGSNPPNTNGDSPAPTVGAVDFVCMAGSYINIGEFVVLANWTSAGGNRRSWVAFTDDDGSTWTWKSISAGATAISSYDTYTDVTDPYPTDDPQRERWYSEAGIRSSAKLTETTYVVLWEQVVSSIGYVQIIDTDGSPGAKVQFSHLGTDVGQYNVCNLGTNTFLIAYSDYDGSTYKLFVRAGQHSSGVITLGTPVELTGGYDTNTSDWSVSRISSTEALLVVGNTAASSGLNHAIVATVSALTVTLGTGTKGTYTTDQVYAARPIVLSSSKAVVVWSSYGGVGIRDIKARVVNLSGATVSPATGVTTIADDDGTMVGFPMGAALTASSFAVSYKRTSDEAYIVVCSVSVTDAITAGTEAIIDDDVWYWPIITAKNSSTVIASYPLVSVWGFNTNIISISGLVPTVGADQYFTPDDDDLLPEPFMKNSGEVLFVYSTTDAGGDLYVRYTIGYLSGGGLFDSSGIMIDSYLGEYAWLTGCDGTNIYALALDLTTMTFVADFDMGPASFSQWSAKTYIAYPFIAWGTYDNVYIFGRMSSPYGLSDPEHIIITEDGGASWISVKNDWGTDHCGSLYEFSDYTLIAIRNRLNQSKLYLGTASNLPVRSTTNLNAGVNYHGMKYSEIDGAIVLASNKGDSVMVVGAIPPYYNWVDITANHGTTRAINGLEIL